MNLSFMTNKQYYQENKHLTEVFTYPLSLMDSSCLLLSLLGSPFASTATASSSSNDGARKRSRMLRCLLLRRARDKDEPLLSVEPTALSSELLPPVEFWCWCWCWCSGALDTVSGGGKMMGNVFQWYRNCSATCNKYKAIEINMKLMNVIKQLYINPKSKIKAGKRFSEEFLDPQLWGQPQQDGRNVSSSNLDDVAEAKKPQFIDTCLRSLRHYSEHLVD